MLARRHRATNPMPTNLPQELGSDSRSVGPVGPVGPVGLVGVAVVELSWLAPGTSLKIVVEPSIGWYESTPSGVSLPVPLS